MVELGLTADIKVIRRAGLKPLMLANLWFIWLIIGGGALS